MPDARPGWRCVFARRRLDIEATSGVAADAHSTGTSALYSAGGMLRLPLRRPRPLLWIQARPDFGSTTGQRQSADGAVRRGATRKQAALTDRGAGEMSRDHSPCQLSCRFPGITPGRVRLEVAPVAAQPASRPGPRCRRPEFREPPRTGGGRYGPVSVGNGRAALGGTSGDDKRDTGARARAPIPCQLCCRIGRMRNDDHAVAIRESRRGEFR